MNKIRLLIVDDHTLFRESLCSHLRAFEDFEIVGEAADGLEAVQKVAQTKPDIILMDFAMPNVNGLQATLQIKRDHPRVKILVLTMYDTGQHIEEILRAGASGYVLKKSPTNELITAIKAVHKGEVFFSPSIAEHILSGFLGHKERSEKDFQNLLTKREFNVLCLIAEGKTNKDIANLLSISVNTVQTHRLNLMKKLAVHDSAQLVRVAIRQGLIVP